MAVKKNFAQSAGSSPKKAKKGTKVIWWIGGFFVALLTLAFIFHQPLSTVHFGICKTYIELNEPFPTRIRYLGLEEKMDSWEVFYRRTDPFGVISVNSMECFFKKNSDGAVTTVLDRVDLNRKRVFSVEDPARVQEFNSAISAIEASNPNLAVPNFPLRDITKYRQFHDDL